MKFKRKISYSILFSGIVTIFSTFFPVIPCRIAPNIPNKIYKWTLCSLGIGTQKNPVEYLGYTNKILNTYLIVFGIIFVVIMVLFYYFFNNK